MLYRGGDDRKPVDSVLPLAGIESFFPELRFPRMGMTFLYGHSSPAISYLLASGSERGLDSSIVDVHIEIGKWMCHKIDMSDNPESGLMNTRFLNIARSRVELAEYIERETVKVVGADVLGSDGWVRGATAFPWLMDTVIQLPEFKHLSVIAYRIKTDRFPELQVATVFDLDAIAVVDGGHHLIGTTIAI